MADSKTTKKLLANSLKELMQEKAFDKISISDICDKCQMNRKSFYYHFRDKYDLVNWIFDVEFTAVIENQLNKSTLEIMHTMNELLYKDRAFYRKALLIYGQNSFMDHFYQTIFGIISSRFEDLMHIKEGHEFQKRYFTDAIVVTYRRWLLEGYDMTPDVFMEELEKCLMILRVESV